MPEKSFTIELQDSSEYQPLLQGPPQTCGMRSGRVYLKPGESCGKHSTKAHEEMLVFLAGKGTAYSEQNPDGLDVGLGKVIYIPPHTEHDIKNTSDSELIYIYCVAPITEK